jgi:glycerol-3-phosphate dehydrogenase
MKAGSERTADLSRRHKVALGPTGMITISGGKLTTYRRMAADTVDEVVKVLGRGARRSPTKHLRLWGAKGTEGLREPGAAERLGTSAAIIEHLVSRYGGEARTVLAMIEADPDLARPLVAALPYLRAEAVYAVRYEMATTVDDVLSRRTRAILLARDAAAAAAHEVANLIAPELGWPPDEVRRQVDAFATIVERERHASQVPEPGVPEAQPTAVQS